jgi:hypothetical protein
VEEGIKGRKTKLLFHLGVVSFCLQSLTDLRGDEVGGGEDAHEVVAADVAAVLPVLVLEGVEQLDALAVDLAAQLVQRAVQRRLLLSCGEMRGR